MTHDTQTPDEAAKALLFPTPESRERLEVATLSLLIRNALLRAIEAEREAAGTTKRDLAGATGLDYAALRRLLTAEDANPTLDTVARLLAATQLRMQLVNERGEVTEIPRGDSDLIPA